MTVGDIKNVEAEAGVIASVIKRPDLTFLSDELKPHFFLDLANGYLYYAACQLAKGGVEKPDAYDFINVLNMHKGTSHVGADVNSIITIQSLQELFNNADMIARDSAEDYALVVKAVVDAAFRRTIYQKLVDCEHLCFKSDCENLEREITSALDNIALEFSNTNKIPPYSDVVESYWHEIEERQNPDTIAAFPFKFGPLNDYAMIERGELVVFGAEQKRGKSMMLLNCAVDLMRSGKKVMYIDSELSSRLFTCRILSHLTGIEFRRIRSGRYDEEEHKQILDAIEWLKHQSFTHLYMPIFDAESLYTNIKKVYHSQGIDAVIVDYFKATGNDTDAYSVYSAMGAMIDMIKNECCGLLNIAGIGAAQATSTGRLADSAKIARNASTIIMIEDKTPEEIQRDGVECGNKKLIVRFNRNGPQHNDGEYIDVNFIGDKVLYEEAKQHSPLDPY